MSQKALLICIIILFSCAKLSYGQYTYNKAANFNGTSSHFTIPSTGKLNFTEEIKIEAWIKPSAYGNMPIVSKGVNTGYHFGMTSTGKLRFYKGSSFVETPGIVPLHTWIHVSAMYMPGACRIVADDQISVTSSALTGPIPVNSNALLIGADGSGNFFQGEIDDVRLWDLTDLSGSLRFVSLATPVIENVYMGLKASYRMNGEGNGTAIYDEVMPYADGAANNVTFIDYSKNPTNHSRYNVTAQFYGNTGFFVSANTPVYNSTTAITLEAWVKKDTSGFNYDYMDILNKSGGTLRNNYNFGIFSGQLTLAINNSARAIQFYSPALMNSRWHHVAATYSAVSGLATLFIDGEQVKQQVFAGNLPIENNPDSLFIGKMGATGIPNTNWVGQMDEVRIWKNTERTPAQIKANMYKNIDYTTPSAPSPENCCVFGFDGKTYNALVNTNLFLPSSILLFKENSYFVSDDGGVFNNGPTSPLLRDDANDFAGSSYSVSTKRAFIPDNNLAGLVDSVYVSGTEPAINLRIFTLINHASLADLSYTAPGTGVILTSPAGTSVVLTPALISGNGKDLMTIFDMNADSTIKFNFSPHKNVSPFSPTVKPANSFAAFSGQQQQGWWKLRITDRLAGNIGYLNGWGVQVQTSTGITTGNQFAGKYELSQNYPNPFNPYTKINYQLKNNAFVTLKVFDMLGKEVASLVNENQNVGSYAVEFKADKYFLSSGTYFYKLEAGEFTETKRMMLIK